MFTFLLSHVPMVLVEFLLNLTTSPLFSGGRALAVLLIVTSHGVEFSMIGLFGFSFQ